jgi:transposase
MNIHKNARLTPQGRLLLAERITEHGWSATQAAQAAGLSTRQAYRWFARYRCDGVAALADPSSAPRHCPHRIRGHGSWKSNGCGDSA